MNLNKEDSLQLIQEYQKHRMLWDPTDKWYFHKIKKNDAWDEVATALNIDVEDAKKKISSLLGSFRREKAKARKTMGTGKGAKDIYRSDWFAFNSFAFLMEKDDPRQTISSEKINDSETTDDSEISEVESEVHLQQETPAFPELGENIEQNRLIFFVFVSFSFLMIRWCITRKAAHFLFIIKLSDIGTL
ncbi:uncharacterized protein [Leptinotarsa decemlineata]|uniref:uncharacterized protein n=1 Tax=Leptinotarsa decemlineata TaxID=7539 RepID=UPI003D3068DA